jgi:hypothetical protein
MAARSFPPRPIACTAPTVADWARRAGREVTEDLIGHPDDTNVPQDWFEPPARDREEP